MQGEAVLAEQTAAESLLRVIDDLPTVPETLLRIWDIIDDPRSSSESLAEVVRLDVPLTAKIVRLANSPYYTGGRERRIGDVKSGITVLGFDTIKQLAICLSVATHLVRDQAKRRSPQLFRALWKHAVVTGVIAKRIAQAVGEGKLEELFTAGLLHDLGKFALVVSRPEPYAAVLEARREQGCSLVEMERSLLGFDHALAGSVLGRAWRFPHLLAESARAHHSVVDEPTPASKDDRDLLIVALADRLAHRVVPAKVDTGFDPGLAPTGLLMLRLGLPPTWDVEETAAIRRDLAQARAYLDIL